MSEEAERKAEKRQVARISVKWVGENLLLWKKSGRPHHACVDCWCKSARINVLYTV